VLSLAQVVLSAQVQLAKHAILLVLPALAMPLLVRPVTPVYYSTETHVFIVAPQINSTTRVSALHAIQLVDPVHH